MSSSGADTSTLVELLRLRAAQSPAEPAFTFLLDGETEEVRLTYQELDQRARAIGAWLQNRGSAGQRALLFYNSGLDFLAAFFGCLYARVVAVPTFPPRLNRPMPRLEAIASNATPSLVLTTDWQRLLVSYVILAVVTGLCGLWLTWLTAKLQLQQVLRMGE